MLNFVGKRSAMIMFLAGIVGLLLAGIEILLSAYFVKLLSLLGIGKTDEGLFQSMLSDFNDPLILLLGFVVVTMLKSLLQIAKGYFAISANELFVTRLRLLCISSTLGKVGQRQNPSRVYSLVSDVFIKSALTLHGVAHSIPLIVQGILLFAFLLNLSIYLSLVGLVFILFAGTVVFFIQKLITSIVNPLKDINDRLYQSLKRILENLVLIRFCKLEKVENDHVVGLLVNYLRRVRKSNFLALASENIPPLLGAVVISVLFLMQLRQPSISPEMFLAFAYVFIRFVQCLSQIINFSSIAIINLPYFNAARSYYRNLPKKEIEGFDACLSGKRCQSEILSRFDTQIEKSDLRLHEPPAIEVIDLSYCYENTRRVVSDLSVTIPSGAQCVIVGSSGAGKSTILNLIVGELQPSAGQIRINGVSPAGFLDAYSQESAYAGPEPLLFEGGVRDNILYGVNRLVSDKEIITVLESLGLGDWLNQFGSDLNLSLGNTGVGISTGQAQRLSIARALLRKPKLLILDEVTANLDIDSEQNVLNILESLKGRSTVIIVTHSAVMMKNADITINLDSEAKNKVKVEN